jgi:16S rRNA (adenine1518-N6/adenine1519-N6)-dimethyltransferase
MRAKKSLGQNFLMHARIAQRIARTAEVPAEVTVFEIGPGTGMLTRELLKLGHTVIALETDESLVEELRETFASDIRAKRLTLIQGDIRTYRLSSLPKKYAVVANIPYYLTGEIFRMFLSAKQQPTQMTLLVQKEVASRIARSAKESILSLSVKAYGTPAYEFTVPRGAFRPAPNVDSAVLSIRDISRAHFKTKGEEERFFKLIHAGFAHKRKFVRNNLIGAGLDPRDIPEKARAEDLSLVVWLTLAHDTH